MDNNTGLYPNLSAIAHSDISKNGKRIFHLDSGIQIFFIYSNGRVTSPSYPSFLSIFIFDEPTRYSDQSEYPDARGFLQVGEWSYPLIPSLSPVLHSFYGAYMFPDISNSVAGTNVGIIIPDFVLPEDREMFESILMQMCSYKEQEVPQGVNVAVEKQKILESTFGQKVSTNLVYGAEAVSNGLVWGSEKLSEWVTYGSDKLTESLASAEQNQSVDPRLVKTAKVAKSVSGKIVQISGFLLNQVGKATIGLGRAVAPLVHREGTKAIANFSGRSDAETGKQVGEVMTVAAGALQGASTVYVGLETAATSLAHSLCQNTVKVVAHKYGDDYGQVVDDSLRAVGQTTVAAHNISAFGVKGLAKRAAKDVGKTIVYEFDEKAAPSAQSEVVKGIEYGADSLRLAEKGGEAKKC